MNAGLESQLLKALCHENHVVNIHTQDSCKPISCFPCSPKPNSKKKRQIRKEITLLFQ